MKKSFRNLNVLFLLLIVLFFIGCSFPDIEDETLNPEGGTNDPEGTVLELLGVDLTPSPRTDPWGNELTDDDQPFGKAVATVGIKRELYTTGYTGGAEGFWEDLDTGINNRIGVVAYDVSWMNTPKKAVSGDLNGDGWDEVVTVVYYANYFDVRIRDIKTSYSYVHTISPGDSRLPGTLLGGYSRDLYFQRDVALGDVDGDGKDEIAITINNHLILLDDRDAGYANLGHKVFDHPAAGYATYLRVECGDIDADQRDEIILTSGSYQIDTVGEYFVFDYPEAGGSINLLTSSHEAEIKKGSISLRGAELALGDFNGDGLDELALGGLETGSDNLWLFILNPLNTTVDNFPMDYQISQTLWFDAAAGLAFSPDTPENFAIPCTVAGDFNGNGLDDIVCYDSTFELNSAGNLGAISGWVDNNTLPFDLAAAGDMNGDGIDELAFYDCDEGDMNGDNLKILTIYGRNEEGNVTTQFYSGISAVGTRPTLCLPNVDDDSSIYKYIGTELHFSDPVILTVMASAPYFEGVAMNPDGGSTSIAFSEGSAEEKSYESSFEVSASITAGFSVGPLDTSVEATYSVGGNWKYGSSTAQSLSYGYDLSQGSDMVIFTCIPMDVYVYEILSSGNDEEVVGDPIVVSVPREMSEYHISVVDYNDIVEADDRITSEVLIHTIGKPFTYADKTVRDQLKSNYADVTIHNAVTQGGWFPDVSNNLGAVPTGSSTNIEAEITSDSVNAWGISFTYSETYQFQLLVGAVYSWEMSHGYSYEHVTTEGVSIEGEVGDLQNVSDLSGRRFEWGMMMYPSEGVVSGQNFNILTYWVNPI